MRRVKAFIAALFLFVVTVLGCHLYIRDGAVADSGALGTLASEDKGKLRALLTENFAENMIPVFGSSEFMHGTDTSYHPAQVFADSDFHPMLIGAGYYQSLSHAVTLASIERSMKVRKAVLILSPQWFRKTGVVDQAYASRFSETHYAGAMENTSLSDESKEYISGRTQKLLTVDAKTQERVTMYDDVLWKQQGDALETVKERTWSAFLHEKELFESMLLGKSKELRNSARASAENDNAGTGSVEPSSEDTSAEDGSAKQSGSENAEQTSESTAAERRDLSTSGEPDWDALLEQAEREGEEHNQNPFYMDDDYYKRLEPHLKAKKDMNSDAVKGYQTGPEYDDLRCFLQVCSELDIRPMLVIVPVNGYYYDHTGFPKEAREKYYAKVKAVAAEYGAEIADFSDQEYTKYFFEDRVHLGKKGWVMVNESIYRFYKEA